MKRRVFIVGLFAIAVGGIAFFVTTQKSPQTGPSLLLTPTPIIRPYTLPSIDRSLAVSGAPRAPLFQKSFRDQSFPEKLPVYKITTVANQVLFLRIGSSLGFANQPRIISDKNFTSWEWKENEKLLTLQPGPPTLVAYKEASSAPDQTVLPQSAVLSVTEKFLSVLPMPTLSLQVDSIKSISTDETGGLMFVQSARTATLARLNFLLNGYRLFIDTTDSPSVSMFIDAKPSVYRASFALPLAFSPVYERPLGSVETAVQALKNGSGILIGVDSVTSISPEMNPPPDFSTVSVSGVSLGYLYLYKEGLVVPVYIFTGTATNNAKRVGPYRATYLVRATN
ncbi:hypothetical protein HY409_02075 [Candidatus Gottesmanbacteria bacterium]|nr:hypothetical protein [Candidatus Gottesmanbacteria bacterium]